ncbi:hypothetical protein ACK1X7_07415 [Streptomyces sp. CY1]|uniref:hypothetical protein n=1 Tax=Streptomyces sp. CY1 TaxID=3388313 RepID=UPI0039A04483
MDAVQDKTTVIEAARAEDIELEPNDIDGVGAVFTIDGMPWVDWLEAMATA